jgi:hypothetical protein
MWSSCFFVQDTFAVSADPISVTQYDAWPFIHWSAQAWRCGWDKTVLLRRVNTHGAKITQEL